jgi:predicted O-methyltransferase YrrM
MTDADVLFVNSVGPGFSFSTTKGQAGLGGSELELVLVAHALARRGHKVVVANGVTSEVTEDGVRYIPLAQAAGMTTRCLYVERMTVPPSGIRTLRVVIRATDICCPPYEVHRPFLESGQAAVVVNTKWQADGFTYAKEKIVIPPALDYDLGSEPPPEKVPGRFVYVSAPMKGLEATLEMWRAFKRKYDGPSGKKKILAKAKLIVAVPGFSDFYGDKPKTLSDADKMMGISFIGSPSLIEYRRLIASAEGLFFVNTMPETFGCCVAFAEKFQTRTHVLCVNGFGGIREAVENGSLITDDPAKFERDFMEAWHSKEAPGRWYVPDRSPDALAPDWESAMRLVGGSAMPAIFGSAPKRPSSEVLSELRDNLLALGDVIDDTTLTDFWRSQMGKVAQLVKTAPIASFLTWSDMVDQSELDVFHPMYDALRADVQWETRWKTLSRKATNTVPHTYSRDSGASPNTVQHTYMLMRYERAAGKRLVDDVDVIVEFGGAHGNFCRMLYNDGFRGSYVILDLPHIREFQRAYLQLCGVPVTSDVVLRDGTATLLVEKNIGALLPMLKGKRVAFVATWSLSEAPLELRSKLFPALHSSCSKYLIATQWPYHQTDPQISNEDYFVDFMKAAGGKFSVENHPDWGGVRYVFGFQSHEARAGSHVCFYENTLPQEQPHHQWGGTARRYWAHDRVLIGGSIMNADDGKALEKLGITHVLSAEHEHDDDGKWPKERRARFEFDDNGMDITEAILHKAMDYAEQTLSDPNAVLYTHCRLGGSRGPSFGYLTLRVALGFDPARAMAAIRQTREPGWTPHNRYIRSIERAIETRPGKDGSRTKLKPDQTTPAVEERVIDAYRDTPTPQRPPQSVEMTMRQENLAINKEPFPPEFGSHLALLRSSLSVGGSEMGLGLMLRAIVASTRASLVVEIGRFQGFSTLALASGVAMVDAGWKEPMAAHQRPDVNYAQLLAKKKRRVVSIDPFPTKEADELLSQARLTDYVEKIDKYSDEVDPGSLGVIDVLLIDGSHLKGDARNDVARYVPHVRPGGYFVIHDYFGWYDDKGNNGSPIKQVIDEDLQDFEQILLDTGFASFVIFRKNAELPPAPERAPPRADGRPTVGLVIIAKGNEGATVVARALVSCMKMVDAMTVVVDGGEDTVNVCRAIGADVYQRKTPEVDWKRGIGFIAAARNEALAIAERKTDYVLILDPDDTIEGEIPKNLTADAYQVYIHDGGLRYPRIQLFKSGKGFFYEGIRHEQLTWRGTAADASSLIYRRIGGNRFATGDQDRDPNTIKYMKHAKDLSKWLIDHPDDCRAQFYLAQSYRDAQQGDKAIVEYERRIAMGGWDEERFFSALQIARIIREQGKDPTTAYMRAYELRPSRAEPLCELANWLRDEKQKRYALAVVVARTASELPIPNDSLFVNVEAYTWLSLQELAISAYWAGNKKAAVMCYEEILRRPTTPDGQKPHLETMLALCRRESGQ